MPTVPLETPGAISPIIKRLIMERIRTVSERQANREKIELRAEFILQSWVISRKFAMVVS